MDRRRNYEVFLQYLLVAIAANCENSSESDKLLVNVRDSVTRLLLVTVRCTMLMRLMRSDFWERFMISWRRVRLIMKRLVRSERLMSNVKLDENCEVHQADEW